MKHHFLRRLTAAALALAIAVSLAVTPALAAGTFGASLSDVSIKKGESKDLTVNVTNRPAGSTLSYEWKSDTADVTVSPADQATAAVAVSGSAAAKTATITVKVTATTPGGGTSGADAVETATATCKVTVTEDAPVNVPLQSLAIVPNTLELTVGGEDTLTVSFTPANASDKNVTWSADASGVVSVDQTGKVKALKEGTATVTVTGEGGKTATCKVTVKAGSTTPPTTPPDPSKDIKSISFISNSEILFNRVTSDPTGVKLSLNPDDAQYNPEDIVWSCVDDKGEPSKVAKVEVNEDGTHATITPLLPGEAKLVVQYKSLKAERTITVSGITLDQTSVEVPLGQNVTLVVNAYGNARTAATYTTWRSKNPSIVAPVESILTTLSLGTTEVTADRGGYTAKCTVRVVEDTTALIVVPGSYTPTSPLNFNNSTIISRLRAIAMEKTKVVAEDGTVTYSTPHYITSLSVPTDQGILYDDHRSQADTGDGMAITEQYYLSNAPIGQASLSQLYFVPRTTFSGTADIKYSCWTLDGQSFSGIIRVTTKAATDVSYSTSGGDAVTFQGDDFDLICRNKTNRTLNYVTFTLPQASAGTLYYNYTGQTTYAEQVSPSTRYSRTGSPSLDRVTFVPAAGFSGTVRIPYYAVSAGGTYNGTVTIQVGGQTGSGTSNITYQAKRGQAVSFRSADFYNACLRATGEGLSRVTFTPPSAQDGTLYSSYSSNPVNASTSYYYQYPSPTIDSVSFTPASTAASTQVAISYTGYSINNRQFYGMVYIQLQETSPQTIQYTVFTGKSVKFQVNDFNNASRALTGYDLNYVTFQQTPTYTQGNLYHNYSSNSGWNSSVNTGTSYYRNGSSQLVGNITFVATSGYTGRVSLNYTGYSTSGTTFSGTVIIEVTPPAAANITYSGSNASPLRLSATRVRAACADVLNKELSYITFTSLPPVTSGRLYSGYSGFGTGTAVSVNTRYYSSGTPSIDQLSFVPRGRSQGAVTVGYTAVSTSGEQVSGKIVFNISATAGSSYFYDMGGHTWAATAVDYLYQNKVTNGVTNTAFGPDQNILRGDFVLMLMRAFGFSAGNGYSFADVPTNSYYAQAIATAKTLGIVNGDGVNFMPNDPLTRQDAMVIIRNTLNSAGHNVGSGVVDLSRFPDNGAIADYARTAVGALVQMGAVNGDERGMLCPWDFITRAEAAVILHFVMTM